MSKKIIAIMLALVMVFALAACGKKEAPASTTPSTTPSSSTPSSSGSSSSGSGSSAPAATGSDTKTYDTPEFTFKFGHDQPDVHYYNSMAVKFAELVKEKTNGRVEIEVYGNAQLGNEATMLESVGMGTLDFLITNSANAAVYVPALAMLSTAYVFDGYEKLAKSLFDEQIETYYQGLVADADLGFQLICFLPGTCRQLYSTFPVHQLSDIKGHKVRVMSAPIESTVWSALGAKPTTVAFGEVYTALQTNLVEGAENSISSYYAAKHYEAAPYLNMTYHEYGIASIWESDATLAQLPDDVQAVIAQCAREACEYGLQAGIDFEVGLVDEMKSLGVTVCDDIDLAPFIEVISPIQDTAAQEMDAVDILARIRSL